jgi:GNAT superfamily N-acetyltransferase
MTQYFIITHPDEDRRGAQRENILIAQDVQGEVLGRLLIYPYPGDPAKGEHPLNLYLNLLLEEGIGEGDRIKDALLERALQRAVEIKEEAGQPTARVYACFFKHQQDEVAYFVSRGFVQDESMYILEWRTGTPLPPVDFPTDVAIRSWDLETDAEKERFIETHRLVFPRHPYSIPQLEQLASQPSWCNYTAWYQGAIAGNIMVFTRQDASECIGVIEDLFVLENYRRKGIGRALLQTTLVYLQSVDLPRVQLEMWSTNQPAFKRYQSLGFKVVVQTELAVGRFV